MNLNQILKAAFEADASDIHLISGHPPMMRVNTVMTPMDYPILTPATVKSFLDEMVNEVKLKRFDEHQDLDFSYGVAELGRYPMRLATRLDPYAKLCIIEHELLRAGYDWPDLKEMMTVLRAVRRAGRAGLVPVLMAEGPVTLTLEERLDFAAAVSAANLFDARRRELLRFALRLWALGCAEEVPA